MVAGLQTFKRGHIWRIGDGSKVNIWTDPWIPSSPDHHIITQRGQTLISKVLDLIDPTNGEWDEVLIRAIFNPVDARRILQIPLNYEAFEDFIDWHHTQTGIFP